MDWQQPAALIIVAAALVLMVRRLMNRGKTGAQPSCAGCGSRGDGSPGRGNPGDTETHEHVTTSS